MAINSAVSSKNIAKSTCSNSSAKSINNCSSARISHSSRSNIKDISYKDICINRGSPYLKDNKIQMVSQVTDKRIVHKKASEFTSSFPLAIKLYKASSAEFKLLRKVNRKVRKSIHTLPNEFAVTPQACTVSDMNESEYYIRENENRKTKSKKRTPLKRKPLKPKNYEVCERDTSYYSKLGIHHLDFSSTDIIKQYNGDCQRRNISNARGECVKANDIWAMLKNINRFQFRPSPPTSVDSIVTPKKKRQNSRKEARFFETCTEEFAYISSIEVDSKPSKPLSQFSSCDRVTIIDKQDEFCNMCKDFEKKIIHNRNSTITANEPKRLKQVRDRVKNKRLTRQRKPEPMSLDTKSLRDETKIFQVNEGLRDLCTNNYNNAPVELKSVSNITIKNNASSRNFLNQEDDVVETIVQPKKPTNSNDLPKGNTSNTNKDLSNGVFTKSNVSAKQMKGITKVVLSKGQIIALSKRLEMQKQKSIVTKSIKPAIANMKMNLDGHKIMSQIKEINKLSTPACIDKYESPQFDGLDKHIWPYMSEWYKEQNKFVDDISKNKKSYMKIEVKPKDKLRKINTEMCHKQHLTNKNKTSVSTVNDNKGEIHKEKLAKNPKQNSVHQFRDKMLKFLYKKQPSSQSIKSHQQIGVQAGTSLTKIDKSIDITTINTKQTSVSPQKSVVSRRNTGVNRKPQDKTHNSWSKAKWASDIIENVIKKVRNGVYYIDNQNEKGIFTSSPKDVSIQAVLNTRNSSTACEEELIDASNEKKANILDPLKALGFDDIVPALEIESFDKNNIFIKHCETNITLQFEVTIPTETNGLIVHSLIPINGTSNKTNLLKYKITMLNAMIPAELCNIIPKIIRSINVIQNGETLQQKLSTITELSHKESPLSLPCPYIPISAEFRGLLNGAFRKYPKKFRAGIHKAKLPAVVYNFSELLPTLQNEMEVYLNVIPNIFSIKEAHSNNISIPLSNLDTKPMNKAITEINKTALVPYYPPKYDLIRSNNYEFSINDVIRAFHKYKHVISLRPCCQNFSFYDCTRNSKVSLYLNVNNQGIEKQANGTVTDIFFDTLYEKFIHNNYRRIDSCVTKSIEYFETLSKRADGKRSCITGCEKKKSYTKLHRKCKSTTNIGSVKCTRISNISNIEDFCQLIGSKSLVSVFDNHTTRKILDTLTELKNWISEINSRHALLVLLLTNKKETPILLRFKPLILQGIALNRITRATELDIEIEVIEKENINDSWKFQGVPFLPDENENNLLEELVWIAKSTASDYQRPFNESTENLIKSLLERRKKLNPSYLRVMARYVGLGLLKTGLKRSQQSNVLGN